jgi:SAM-dependent methyltransferase
MYLLPKMHEEQRLLANRNSKESMEDLFRLKYHHNLWSSSESKSGPGSTLFQTKNIIEELPLLLKKYEIKSILDIPCGDFHWMKNVDLTGIDYTGADIVPEIIADNKAKAPHKFEVLDIVHDDLPKVDLILCRDLMFHLPFESILKALENISKSGSKYLLATNHTWKRDSNQDISVGEWRRLNMREEPLNLPPFIDLIVEGNTEGNQEDRCLCLWKLN